MKNYFNLLLLFSLILYTACTGSQEPGENDQYVLKGEVSGFDDSTYLYLSADNVTIDSVMILDGRFELIGSVAEPTNVYLMTRPPYAYTSFWLENAEVRLKGNKEDFRNAEVSGSEVNAQQKELRSLLAPIEKANDSLSNILMRISMRRLQVPDEKRKALLQEYQNTEEQMTAVYQQFVQEHPGSYLSAMLLDIYKTTWGKDKTEELYAGFPESLHGSYYGKNIADYLKVAKSVKIGDPYSDFTMTSYQGEEVTLSDIKDKYVLLEFWASWCAPCREENPQLVETYNEFKDKGFEILGVSLDLDEAAWKKAIETDGLPWPNVSDLQGDQNKAGLMYGVSGIPDNFLIDPEGKIVDRNLRGNDLREKLEEVFSVEN